MKIAKNTKKIVMNQLLSPPSPVFSRIESPLILSVLLVGLLILTACGGAAAIPTSFVNSNTSNSNGSGDGSGDGSNNRQLQPDTDPEPDPVPEPDTVTSDDWTTSFSSPLAVEDYSNRRNQFLSILDLSRFNQGIRLLIFGSTNYNTSSFDGQRLGISIHGGQGASLGRRSVIVGSGRSQREETYYYASVLTNTNVGAPLAVFEAGNPISANWNGSFKTTHFSSLLESEDFTLTVNFRDSTIEAFFNDVYAEIDNHYHLNGSYDTGGIITGTVNYGTFSDIDARTPTDNRAANGILTGIIGQDFAVGAFVSGTSTDGGVTITGGTGDDGFAGEFIVSSTATYRPNITNGDWHRSFATSLKKLPNRTNPRNQFVKSSNRDNQGTWLFGSASFDGLGINLGEGRGRGGLVYNIIQIDGTRYYHATIRDMNRLPLPAHEAGNPISANWNGNFSAGGGTNAVIGADFTLTVNFRDSTIEAFVRQGATSNYYHIKGNYANIAERGAGGIITGTVNYGTFSDIDARTPTNNRPANGVLTGLISQGAAFGVFVSGTSTDGGATITGGTGDDGFAGGFIAAPTATYDPNVAIGDWRRSFASPLSTQPETTNPRNQFVNGIASATNQKLASLTNIFDGVMSQLSGSSQIATRSIDETRYYYADIGATNLGLPLPVFETGNRVSAVWNGKFAALQGADGETDTDFALTVNFRDSKVEAFVKEGDDTSNYYHIEGNYANNAARNADGVITGTVNYGTFSDVDARTPTDNRANNGVLTGIIGQDGARAAFISGTTSDGGLTITGGTGDDGFAGGFWAGPTVDYLPAVTREDWLRSFATSLPPVDTTNRRNQFLREPTISQSIRYSRITSTFDGVSQFSNPSFYRRITFRFDTEFYEAGIDGEANLGLPLPVFETGNTVSADWNGHINALHGATGGFDTDFALTVNFRDSTVEAFVRDDDTSNYYHIEGNYANNAARNADGVITGTVNYGTFSDVDARTPTDNRANNGVLTGIIGQDGAQAVFVSGTTSDGGLTITGGTGDDGFAGGFWATPTTNYIVNRADWTRSFLFSPLPVIDTTNRRNQFVYSFSTSGLTDTDSDSIGGIFFGTGTDDGVQYYYASISNTVNMGAVLPEFQTGNTASARWNGRFHAYEGATGEVETDFILEVDFENSRLFAFITPEGGRGDYNMNAGYGAEGVISGTITRGFNTQGLVTGLIGQNGATAAFVSGEGVNGGFTTIEGGTGENGYVGGFTATPPSE